MGAIPKDKGFQWAYTISGIMFVLGTIAFGVATMGLQESTMRGGICKRRAEVGQKITTTNNSNNEEDYTNDGANNNTDSVDLENEKMPYQQIWDSIWHHGWSGFTGFGDWRGAVGLTSWFCLIFAVIWSFINAVIPDNKISPGLSYVSLVMFFAFFVLNIIAYKNAEDWVVDSDVGKFLQLTTVQIPPLSFMFIAFSSGMTGMVQSTCQFDVRLFGGDYQFNGSFLFPFVGIGALFWTGILNYDIEPFLQKHGWQMKFGVKARLITGALAFMVAMAFAAGFEVFRRNLANVPNQHFQFTK